MPEPPVACAHGTQLGRARMEPYQHLATRGLFSCCSHYLTLTPRVMHLILP